MANDCVGIVHKYNGATGQLVWTKTWNEVTDVDGVQVDPADNSIYITGQFTGSNVVLGGTATTQTSARGGTAASTITMKLNYNGSPVWGKSIGAGGPGFSTPIALDHARNVVYVTGSNSIADQGLTGSGANCGGGFGGGGGQQTSTHCPSNHCPSNQRAWRQHA